MNPKGSQNAPTAQQLIDSARFDEERKGCNCKPEITVRELRCRRIQYAQIQHYSRCALVRRMVTTA